MVFCFDGDQAGRDAAWKALQTVLPLMRDGRQARFLFLPDGEDPDSLVRRIGADAFAGRSRRAQPLSTFLFDKLAGQVDMQSLDGRARLGELAKPLLERLPAGLFRDMMEQSLYERVGLKTQPAETQPAQRPPGHALQRPQGSIRPPAGRCPAGAAPELADRTADGWQALTHRHR